MFLSESWMWNSQLILDAPQVCDLCTYYTVCRTFEQQCQNYMFEKGITNYTLQFRKLQDRIVYEFVSLNSTNPTVEFALMYKTEIELFLKTFNHLRRKIILFLFNADSAI